MSINNNGNTLETTDKAIYGESNLKERHSRKYGDIVIGITATIPQNVILLSFFTSVLIEALQYIETYLKIVYAPRASDILDVMLNTLGGIIGFCVYRIYLRFCKK